MRTQYMLKVVQIGNMKMSSNLMAKMRCFSDRRIIKAFDIEYEDSEF